MAPKVVVTGARYVQDVRDQFYFSSPENFGGGVQVGDQVAVVSKQTGNVLALGEVIDGGKPYEECRSVKVTKRFA